MPGLRVASGALPYGPTVTFRTQGILPPSAVYVGPDDALTLDSRSPSVASNLNLTVRRLTPQGEIKSDQLDFTSVPNGAIVQSNVMPPSEGFLLSAHLRGDAVTRGQCFAKFHIRRSTSGSDLTLGNLLFQGYVSGDDHLGYPQSPTESSLAGRGWLKPFPVGAPAAGAQWTVTVPAGVQWILRAISASFTASAAVATRWPFVFIQDGAGNTLLRNIVPASVTAGLQFFLDWAPGNVDFTPGTNLQKMGMPQEFRLRSGWTVNSFVENMQAADTWTLIVLVVEEFVGT